MGSRRLPRTLARRRTLCSAARSPTAAEANLVHALPPRTCSLSFARIAVVAFLTTGCAGFPDAPPQTDVVLENRYAPDTALIVYDAHWLNASFAGEPLAPGSSSPPQSTVPASADNTAYVVLAPRWDPASTSPPRTLIALESRAGFAVALGDTLHIRVEDDAFEGNCVSGSHLTQDQADFLTQVVFAADFDGLSYEAATCTTTPNGGAGAP
jgi:hypothetical protein